MVNLPVDSEKSEQNSFIINKPYPYQEKVFEKIKDQDNSIIFMETGKGKTLISIMLIGHILNIDIFKQNFKKNQSNQKKSNLSRVRGGVSRATKISNKK